MAQSDPPMKEESAARAGSMDAAGELCGLVTSAEVKKSTEQLRARAATRGLSGDRFEKAYQGGFDQAKALFTAEPIAKREQAAFR